MSDDITPDLYAQITAADYDDDGLLVLTVSTVNPLNIDGDLADDEIVLTAELPFVTPRTFSDYLIHDIIGERTTMLRDWYQDGDDARAELETREPLRYLRVDVYFIEDVDKPGEYEEFRFCKLNDRGDYFAILPDSRDQYDIWREGDFWYTNFAGEERNGYPSFAELRDSVYLAP